MSIPHPPALWDFAGFDGLALACELFGPAVSELAVYQSQDTDWGETHCALLRLCENNFRAGFYGAISADDQADFEDRLRANAAARRVWIKRTSLASIFLSAEPEWNTLEQITTTKVPHRLTGLPVNRAVPARIADHAVLVWRHFLEGRLTVEVQVAPGELEAVRQFF